MTDTRFDPRHFGVVGDGVTDDTAALQAALDAAATVRGTVYLPDGVYCCGRLRMPSYTGLVGNATWGYREGGGTVLTLTDPTAPCLFDITRAVGVTLHGLSLDGGKLGSGIHAIAQFPVAGNSEEWAPRIERCHIRRFTGDGVHLAQAWCFSIRSCEVIFNDGHGLYVRGWDGFILDNWFSGNGQAGYCAEGPNASVTMTGNRIEWNRGGGIRIAGGSHYNLTGNYIDRSGGPAIALLTRDGAPCFGITVTGNVIYRSGKPEWTTDALDSTHLRIEGAHGVTVTGNSLCVGHDDTGGTLSPRHGLVVRALQNCVIAGNTLHVGALEALITDLGEHRDGVVIKDNPGSLYIDRGGSIWSSGQL
jgi:hypothetical protein